MPFLKLNQFKNSIKRNNIQKQINFNNSQELPEIIKKVNSHIN